MEYAAKRCRHGTRMSCVPPTIYARRFYDFMEEIFDVKIDDKEYSDDELEFA